MTLTPAFRAFIDESNTPLFRSGIDDRRRPYVACSAIVPAKDELAVLKAIPCDPQSGERLKGSSRNMTDALAANFIKAVLSTESVISIVGVDGGDSANIEGATRLTEGANHYRRQSKRPVISRGSAMYLLTASKALSEALLSFYKRNGPYLSFFDVVFDHGNIKGKETERVAETLKAVYSKNGFTVQSISWSSEEEEPLLFIPDIFSGVTRRQATHNDLPQAWSQIQRAIQSKRLVYKDGI